MSKDSIDRAAGRKIITIEPISKQVNSVTPVKADVQKKNENTG
jgi:hypothetical protein